MATPEGAVLVLCKDERIVQPTETFHGDVVAEQKAAAERKSGLARQLLDAFELITELRRDLVNERETRGTALFDLRRDMGAIREAINKEAKARQIGDANTRDRYVVAFDAASPPRHEDAGKAEDADYIRYIAKTFFPHRHFINKTLNEVADRMTP